jgi:hypothetical protein
MIKLIKMSILVALASCSRGAKQTHADEQAHTDEPTTIDSNSMLERILNADFGYADSAFRVVERHVIDRGTVPAARTPDCRPEREAGRLEP